MTVGEGIGLVEGILTTARALGDITAYETSYAYDPAGEILHVQARYAVSSPPKYIRISISQPDSK